MQLELSGEEAALLRDLLRQRLLELETEINRTDSLSFKKDLQQMERALERILGEISSRLDHSRP